VLGNQAEKAFDLIDPRGEGRGEVHVKARMPFEPGLNLGVLVGGVVVGDQVHGEVLRCLSIDAAQEFEPFLMPVSRHALTNHLASGNLARREQRGRAIALVVCVMVPQRRLLASEH
jgi:hypothetical protein